MMCFEFSRLAWNNDSYWSEAACLTPPLNEDESQPPSAAWVIQPRLTSCRKSYVMYRRDVHSRIQGDTCNGYRPKGPEWVSLNDTLRVEGRLSRWNSRVRFVSVSSVSSADYCCCHNNEIDKPSCQSDLVAQLFLASRSSSCHVILTSVQLVRFELLFDKTTRGGPAGRDGTRPLSSLQCRLPPLLLSRIDLSSAFGGGTEIGKRSGNSVSRENKE